MVARLIGPDLLTRGEVAALFKKHGVRSASVAKLRVVRTLGGHRRFPRTEVEAVLLRERTR